MEKQVINAIEKVLNSTRLLPFNWKLINYSLDHKEYDENEFVGFKIFDNDGDLANCQLARPIPETIKNIILTDYDIGFVVSMNEDSITKFLGIYPKSTGRPILNQRISQQDFSTIYRFGNNLIIEQVDKMMDTTLALISINDYKVAQYYSVNPWTYDYDWKFTNFSKNDYIQYGREILNIEF